MKQEREYEPSKRYIIEQKTHKERVSAAPRKKVL